MKSNHLLLLALKKVREHVGEGTNTFRFLTSELGLLRSIQGIADVIHFIPMEGQPYRLTEGRVVFFRAGTLRLRINLREVEFKAGDLLVVSPGTVFEFLYVFRFGYAGLFKQFDGELAERGFVADLFAGEIVFASVFNCERSAAHGAVVCLVMGSGARPAFSESFRAEFDFSVLSSTGFCQEKQSIY